MTKLLPIGTKINNTLAHGKGIIVGYNTAKPISNEHLKEFAGKIPAELMMTGIYSGDRYPYVIQYEDGYKDVYSDYALEVIK